MSVCIAYLKPTSADNMLSDDEFDDAIIYCGSSEQPIGGLFGPMEKERNGKLELMFAAECCAAFLEWLSAIGIEDVRFLSASEFGNMQHIWLDEMQAAGWMGL